MTARKFVVWRGIKVPLVQDHGGIYRIRARSRTLQVDLCLNTKNEAQAKTRAKEALERGEGRKTTASKGTLEEVAECYLSLPKRTAPKVAESNVARLRTVCRLSLDAELKDIPIAKAGAKLWTQYQRKRLESIGHELDYSRRIRENIGINAAVRAARCLFIRRLRPAYKENGIILAEDADVVTWLPEPAMTKPKADDAAMLDAWRALPQDALWFAVGLARFAGLRRSEILHARRSWVVERAGVVLIELCDRPEDGWQTKTGKPYMARVIDPAFASALLDAPAGHIVRPTEPDRARWMERAPQAWARPFVGDVIKPLHRLRGAYADAVATLTADAVTARLAGVKAAQEALGHTTSATTERHYLTS
jgi:integrase